MRCQHGGASGVRRRGERLSSRTGRQYTTQGHWQGHSTSDTLGTPRSVPGSSLLGLSTHTHTGSDAKGARPLVAQRQPFAPGNLFSFTAAQIKPAVLWSELNSADASCCGIWSDRCTKRGLRGGPRLSIAKLELLNPSVVKWTGAVLIWVHRPCHFAAVQRLGIHLLDMLSRRCCS